MLTFLVQYHNKMSGRIDAEAANKEFQGNVPRFKSNKVNII